MIVVCTGCSAKFRVADEKVGPRGAKLRCSKCQTVFTVQRPALEPPPAAADPFETPPPPRIGPPPLPRRATTLDARAAFEVDLLPHLGAAPAPADPFAPISTPASSLPDPGDPFSPPPGRAGHVVDPFGAPPVADPPADPFAEEAGVTARSPASGEEPATIARPDLDPFSHSDPASTDPLEGIGAVAAAAPGTVTSGSLALEELTTPPARRLGRPRAMEPAPMPVIAATEDPFAGPGPFDAGLSELDGGVLAAAPSEGSGRERTTPPPQAMVDAEPLQLDPFGAAAVAADPLVVDEPPRVAAAQPPAETTAEGGAATRGFRVRGVLVNAMALAALLLLSVAIVAIWRGGLAPSDALRPAAIIAALSPRPLPGAVTASGVTSGRYERARGAPLLFVRGTVVSTAASPLDGVRVVVEVVRDGAVLVQGEVPIGAVPGPEALYAAADAAALAGAMADAATPGGARLSPGGSAPFLVAFVDYPTDLGGATLRVRTVAGEAR
jgi:predicted Zn finger-like uncharacterized protein